MKKLTIEKQGSQIKRNIKTENGKERGYKKRFTECKGIHKEGRKKHKQGVNFTNIL